MTDRDLARAVSSGALTRLRDGVYAGPDLDANIQAAVARGGRLTCGSELRRRGVWMIDSALHVHVSPRAARVSPGGAVVHRARLIRPPQAGSVHIVDALAQAIRCLPLRDAMAAIDSARHRHVVGPADLAELAGVSSRAARFLAASDASAESGLETFARLIAADLGLRVRSQVRFPGVGRVDLVLEGWVVVEADGDTFHSDVSARRRDRRRDAVLAAIGCTVVRFGFDQLVLRPDEVAQAMVHAVRTHRGVKDAGRIAHRAQHRASLLYPPFTFDA